MKYRKRLRIESLDIPEYWQEAARILKFFGARYVEVTNSEVCFQNIFTGQLTLTLMTPLDGGMVKMTKISDSRFKLTYEFRFGRFGYPGILIPLLLYIFYRPAFHGSLIFLAICTALLLVSQWYIFWELINELKIENTHSNTM